MKFILFLLFSIFFFSSCSTHVERSPSSANSGSCMDLISSFTSNRLHQYDVQEIRKIRNAFNVSGKNMNDVLENPFYKRKVFDSQNDELNEKSALIINMIAKSRPDFDEKRVLMRYRRLFNLCDS